VIYIITKFNLEASNFGVSLQLQAITSTHLVVLVCHCLQCVLT